MTRRLRFGWILACALLVTSCNDVPAKREPGPVDLQGHRGARGLLPENTLAGFDHAINLEVTTLELDLGLTQDDVVVITHDPYVNPKVCQHADGSPIEEERGPRVRDLTLAELQAFDCGSLNPDPLRFPEPPRTNVPGETIPTLAALFDRVKERESGVRFNVEIKATPEQNDTAPLPHFVDRVVATIRDAGMVERTTVQSFLWRALELTKEREPRLRTAGLVSPETLGPEWLGGLVRDDYADFLGVLAAAGYIDELSPYWIQLVPGAYSLGLGVRNFQAAGYRVIPWTVNDAGDIRAMLGIGVDGIITDYPNRVLDEIRGTAHSVERPSAKD
ncbi:MAG: glycerophosphodiester phosphodiesterase family protein [Myxococcota bacterium]